MFERSLSSAHEPDAVTLMRLLDEATPRMVESPHVGRTLRRRDRMLALELESSHLLGPFVGTLVRLFPEARFVLPIRDCRSWLRSIINQQLRKRSSPKDVKWQRVWDVCFQADRLEHPPEEAALRRRGLHTLDGYLSYWRTHNERVLEAVPEERLFVLRTTDIKPRARELAEFLGLSATSVDAFSGHAYRACADFRVLEELDPEYLRAKFEVHCGELMRRYYPSLTPLEDPAASGLLGG